MNTISTKNSHSMHYWRIHAKVTKRLWTDINHRLRDAIAFDVDHSGEEFKWFQAKVDADTQRLYEDPSYFDNEPSSFKYSK